MLLVAVLLTTARSAAPSCDASTSAPDAPDETGITFLQVGFADTEAESAGIETKPDSFIREGVTCFSHRERIRDTYNAQSVLHLSSALTPEQSLQHPELGLYNPSVIELPKNYTSVHKSFPTAKYAMTIRRSWDQCSASTTKGTIGSGLRSVFGKLWTSIATGFWTSTLALNIYRYGGWALGWGTADLAQDDSGPLFLLLDSNFCVLSRTNLEFNDLPSSGVDIRLFLHEGNLYTTFSITENIYDSFPHFAPVEFAALGMPWNITTTAAVHGSRTVQMGGVNEKNYGLFASRSGLKALSWINIPAEAETSLMVKGVWHNSVNLLKINDGSDDLLGMMHIHREKDATVLGRAKAFATNSLLYGTNYSQRFFRLQGKAPFHLIAAGDEFCISDSAGDCESIQMVMSMEQIEANKLLVSFGSNDCAANLAELELSAVLKGLKPMWPEVTTTVVDWKEVPSSTEP